MSVDCGIEIEFDAASKHYYIIWEVPVAIGSGKTEIEALHDLRNTARFCIDTLINQKLEDFSKEG